MNGKQQTLSFLNTVNLLLSGLLFTVEGNTSVWVEPKLIYRPKAGLTADSRDIPEGGTVTLTCSVNPPSGWKYTFWYKQDELASYKVVEGSGVSSSGQIQVSEEGLYQCRGERGNSLYYTESSDKISINKKNANKAVLTLHPDWSEIFFGEKTTLRCEIEGRDDNEWDYEWETTSSSSLKPEKKKEFNIPFAVTSLSGDYKCRGRKKSDRSSTDWSNPVTLTVSLYKPEPVLNVSLLWLSPGDSVTLSCEVKDPSAGWRFYWYKTVPKLPGDSYSYELLSESSSGTEQSSFIVHGQTHTAGYVCRAGRGDPVFHSEYSAPKFVWSADFHPSASLRVSPNRVSPNRVQHFTSDSVSLSCEGNSAQWRVMRFLTERIVSGCSKFWTKTESSCTIPTNSSSDDVFWCESESGEFSNAVNITKQSDDIILESPVHPVTEGSSVSLSCRLRSTDVVSHIFFYHNDKLIQNDTRRELNISAVSASDKGFYKCQSSGRESAQSWMAVRGGWAVSRPGSSLFFMTLMSIALICGLIILVLLLLCYFRNFKGSCFCRLVQSGSPDQDFPSSHVVDQSDAQYSSLLHADTCVYDSLRGPEDYENVQLRRINQDLSTRQVVDQREAENDQYSTLLHGDTSFYETIKGSGKYPTACLTLKHSWSQIFWLETVTLRCEIEGSEDTGWKYGWKIRGRDLPLTTQNEYSVRDATHDHNGEYECLGRKGNFDTSWSEPFTLTVTPQKPRAELKADKYTIPAGGAVTLNCNVNPPSSGWEFHWYRGEITSEIKITEDDHYSVTQGGPYQCRGARGDPPYYTDFSYQVPIFKILPNRAVVTLDSEWSEIFSGETITLRCVIQDGEDTKWKYEWETTDSEFPKHSESASVRAVVHSGGEYKCLGKLQTDLYSLTEWSNPPTVSVSDRPKAELTADNRDFPEGGTVTLTCSVNPPSGWKYTFWYKQDKYASYKVVEGSGVSSSGQIQVSEEGLYQCRGERGKPLYYTKSSDEISINKKNANKAVLTLHPDRSEIYSEEKMTLKCEIEGEDDNEWDYEWETTSSSSRKPEKEKEFSITSAFTSLSGDYKCRGRKKSVRSSTVWSNTITLTVSLYKPKPVLNVSLLWLSPGDLVTLSCGVKDPSAGWRFYWYKTVPKLPGDSYSYELLSESSSGTEQSSFIVHGQTHTAGYVCRAGRGDPVFHSEYSAPKFVWSGDFHPSASLRVSLNRVQHFTSDSVSLSCEGNSSQWRVMRFLKKGTVSGCSTLPTKTESSCTIPTNRPSDDVFWCESKSGEFSNAVNITKQSDDIILESPVHPVTEGSSVSLSCRFRSRDVVSHIFFYHNDKLIQNDTRRERNISAVSASDEGFYKCQSSGRESAQSWMAVRAVSKPGKSSSLMILVGPICGVVLLVLLLLLLYRYRQAIVRCCSRSLKPKIRDQNTATNQDDASLYESVKDHRESANGTDAGPSQDVTYSMVEIKNAGKNGRKPEPSEIAVYSDVKIHTADDIVTYAQVSCHSTGKDKKKKGKSKTAPTEDTVYSEVKPGTTSGQ
ncbi:uncharacterized protein LOC141784554 [Halichoeres trimaculatus]|uniref:uncharacterized protein LOC141784554 n=1 Tax=Halichoeres trimaculatus TaxID=147232 RepID=UPI003D9F5500